MSYRGLSIGLHRDDASYRTGRHSFAEERFGGRSVRDDEGGGEGEEDNGG